MYGWISLHRKLLEHWLWQDKPFSKGQAWLDLLLNTAHKETTSMYRNSVLHLAQGELVISHRKLAESWGWNKEKVGRFLHLLEKEAMITIRIDHHLTVISICNYAEYQDLKASIQDTNIDTNIDSNIDSNIDVNINKNRDNQVDIHTDINQGNDADKNNNINNINKTNKINKNNKKIISRAREDFFLEFFEMYKTEDLTRYWNELNLQRLEYVDDDCLRLIFNRYVNYIETHIPNTPNIDEVTTEEWQAFTETCIGRMLDPTDWSLNYLVNGFNEITTQYHRGHNDAHWKADIFYAFKPEVMAKVRRATGIY
ncbi:hypothetical protein [Vibrio jasicida]|uniref:hypothetical protein n=1 Tax=Vibrio jasicida TaxID=766224 RepID=UPI000698302E|nr:hypothetical protein [Vibrio jasicida]